MLWLAGCVAGDDDPGRSCVQIPDQWVTSCTVREEPGWCVVTRVGRRSREMSFEARVVCRADVARGPSTGVLLDPPIVAVTAAGTVVVPERLPGQTHQPQKPPLSTCPAIMSKTGTIYPICGCVSRVKSFSD